MLFMQATFWKVNERNLAILTIDCMVEWIIFFTSWLTDHLIECVDLLIN